MQSVVFSYMYRVLFVWLLLANFWACDRVKEPIKPGLDVRILLEHDFIGLSTADTFGVEVDVLANDIIGDTALLKIEMSPLFGSLKTAPDKNKFFYIPKKYFAGFDTAAYQVCSKDTCKRAFIFFRIRDTLNIAQIYALPDSIEITEGQERLLDILANDILKGNSVQIYAQPTQSMVGQKVRLSFPYPVFSPNPSESSFVFDKFSYTIKASILNSSATEVRVKILPDCKGKRFQAVDDTIELRTTAYSALTQNLLLNDSMCTEDRSRASIKLIRSTSKGNLDFNELIFSYVTNQLESDVFEYEVCVASICRKAKVYFVPAP